jgi:F0F1-type ATP synthase assembly protein I
MGETDRRRGLGGLRYVGVGFSFAVIVAAGWFVGQWADGRFGTAPWLTLAGTLLGVALAMFDLIKTAAALERREEENKD